jgi:hypothetical protein
VRLYHWKPEGRGENWGDYLAVVILRALGVEPEPPEPGEPCLFACGSILSPSHYESCRPSRAVVWGSGGGFPSPGDPPLDFRAVRGPLTAGVFGLGDGVPLGDPALLLPELVKLPDVRNAGTLYVAHVGDPEEYPDWAGAAVHTRVAGEADALTLAGRVASADFVATASLHGAIVAHAYGTPWGPCSVHGQQVSFKWDDWLSYLGLPALEGELPSSLAGARLWWDRHGRHGRGRDVGPLADAFPAGLG